MNQRSEEQNLGTSWVRTQHSLDMYFCQRHTPLPLRSDAVVCTFDKSTCPMKHIVNELLENYSRQTVKVIHTEYPKASRAIYNSHLSSMPMRDAKKPTPYYVPKVNSLLQSNYEIMPDPITTSLIGCPNFPACIDSAHNCNGFRPASCKNYILK